MANVKPLVQTTGRRKSSVARVRLYDGTGVYELNGRSLTDYFPDPELQRRIEEAFKVTDTEGRYDIRAKLEGARPAGRRSSPSGSVRRRRCDGPGIVWLLTEPASSEPTVSVAAPTPS